MLDLVVLVRLEPSGRFRLPEPEVLMVVGRQANWIDSVLAWQGHYRNPTYTTEMGKDRTTTTCKTPEPCEFRSLRNAEEQCSRRSRRGQISTVQCPAVKLLQGLSAELYSREPVPEARTRLAMAMTMAMRRGRRLVSLRRRRTSLVSRVFR